MTCWKIQWLRVFCIVIWLGPATPTLAQTLTEQLLAEDPTELAAAAQQHGDIVRGAILFHQGNINCAKCHRATSEQQRFGPDLASLNPDTPDRLIVEAILQPSREIRDGFETIVVTTLDGRTHFGLVVEKNRRQIVLRDRSEVDRLITLPMQDVDELQVGRISSMPEDLANQLKNRQQFLDLVRYVIEVKRRGPSSQPPADAVGQRRQLSPEMEGLVLLQEKNCLTCHSDQPWTQHLHPLPAPDLAWAANWLNPRYLVDYIADPSACKPGTTMPQTLSHLSVDDRRDVANALTHFLMSIGEHSETTHPVDLPARARGEAAFHAIGCVACHDPRDETATELLWESSVPMGDLSRKYTLPGLVVFLEDPLTARPSGRMPQMALKHDEAIDIAHYLLQRPPPTADTWKVDAQLAAKGEALFIELGCHACHADPAGRDVDPLGSNPLQGPPLSNLRLDQGCLAAPAAEEAGQDPSHPVFSLTAEERSSLQAVVRDYPEQLTPRQQIDVSVRSLRCIACHERDSLGGVSAQRNPHFQTTNLNLGDQGRIPPPLTGVGAKLRGSWMRDVLVNGRTIRPYMKTRMPQYAAAQVEPLAALLQATDRLPRPAYAAFDDQKAMRETGLHLAGNQGLNCVACHTYKYQLSDTMPAVDLTEMTERLEKDWFYGYMLDPQRFSPNTVMPSFWPSGQAIRDDLSGDAAFQIEALWQYLIDGRQAAAPRGVVREPLEIGVAEETRLLRRSYPGIGKRGIGVGYPGGVNLAFDAEQMRLGMVWRGKFVDPAGVWTGQGSGQVQPLGAAIPFVAGPDLDQPASPWVANTDRPPQHQFRGYSLDDNQQPTFRYTIQDIEVQDFFTPFFDEASQLPQLRRRLTCSGPTDQGSLSFRIAVDHANLVQSGNEFAIGDRLKIRIISGQAAEILRDGETRQLRITWKLKDEDPQDGDPPPLIVEYIWN